jgi:hypothetical protein
MNLSVDYSERVYNALLSLYPVHFRMRFGPEMSQLFHDCCHQALKQGQFAILTAFWFQAMKDLTLSILRERQRELMGPISEHPLIGFVDLLLIPSMVTANLLALGPLLTLLIRGGDNISMDQFMMTSAFFSVAIGSLAVVASLVITRLRPSVRLWVKLSV